jgi:hypothetical protein
LDLPEVGWRLGLNSFGSEQEEVAGPCEYGNEPLGSINGIESEWMNKC